MRALKNFGRFLRELWAFAREHKAWWIVPVVIMAIAAVGLVVVAATDVAPYIYTFFQAGR